VTYSDAIALLAEHQYVPGESNTSRMQEPLRGQIKAACRAVHVFHMENGAPAPEPAPPPPKPKRAPRRTRKKKESP